MSDTAAASFRLTGIEDTRRLAAALADVTGAGDLIALSGDLGSGKSELSRCLIRYLLDDPQAEVPSPTFTLVQQYDVPGGRTILHCDLYRLGDPEELYELGLDDMRASALLLVEWPDRLPADWLEDAVHISLDILPERNGDGENHRLVRLAFLARSEAAANTVRQLMDKGTR